MSKVKGKVTLRNIQLNDVPTRQTRMFIKIKNCVKSVTTKPYPISNNQCVWTDPIDLEVNLPQNILKSRRIKALRLSFRFENPSGDGFTRYGIAMLDLVKIILSKNLQIKMKLENCSEKPELSLELEFPPGVILPGPPQQISHSTSISFTASEATDMSTSTSMAGNSKSTSVNSSQGSPPNSHSMATSASLSRSAGRSIAKSLSNSNTSNNNSYNNSYNNSNNSYNNNNSNNNDSNNSNNNSINSNNTGNNNNGSGSSVTVPSLSNTASMTNSSPKQVTPLDTLPIKMTQERYDELENQIDNLLAGIINDEPIQ